MTVLIGEDVWCIGCGSPQQLIFTYKEQDYYRCINCKIVFTYPLPGDLAIQSHYETEL